MLKCTGLKKLSHYQKHSLMLAFSVMFKKKCSCKFKTLVKLGKIVSCTRWTLPSFPRHSTVCQSPVPHCAAVMRAGGRTLFNTPGFVVVTVGADTPGFVLVTVGADTPGFVVVTVGAEADTPGFVLVTVGADTPGFVVVTVGAEAVQHTWLCGGHCWG